MDKRPTAKVTLDFPITISGVEVKHLTMRRPKVRDEMAFAKSKADDADKAINLMASLCEIEPDALLDLDSADFAKLEAQLLDFKGAKS
jgi:hypothetical protein